MKVGDMVRWIGYPGASQPPHETGPSTVGIIVSVRKHWNFKRVTVAWGDGTFGNQLYPKTLEVVHEAR